MPRPAGSDASVSQLLLLFRTIVRYYEVQEYNIDDGTGWARAKEPSTLTLTSHIRFSHDLELLAAQEILFPGCSRP